MNFTEEQIIRYSRNIILREVGGEGQRRLLESKVLVIGAGGLGSPILLYLAAAGVGTLGIIDSDVVDLSNLQRQIIHFTPDINIPKVDSAKSKIKQLNPDVNVITYNVRLSSKNIVEIIKDYDFIIDGTDNFPTKFLVNDACVMNNKPFSHAGILRFEGQTFTYTPGNMCYRCIFNEPPPKGVVPTCSEAGILGAVAGVIGTIQAVEALKYILQNGDLLTNKLLTFNALTTQFREIKLNRNENCPVCGKSPTIKELQDYEQPVCELKL
ncbi:MAG: molybdopterin-synthase adenylyltransferase MoeB [Stygiobacter sp.]